MARGPVSAAYTAERAASLAGVPLRTVYHWAQTGLVRPSVSAYKIMRWSYADLLILRLVEWLRRDKPYPKIPRTSMKLIRQTLDRVPDLGDKLLDRGLDVWITPGGTLVFESLNGLHVPLGKGIAQQLVDVRLDLVRPFEITPGLKGPNLVVPRPTLRIVPGKLSGEPHVLDTRIPTVLVASLSREGYRTEQISELYPELTAANIEEAIDLERQLAGNLRRAA
jgi:uncharacterized protein (DUF433 family)